jgi:hypothetical protein
VSKILQQDLSSKKCVKCSDNLSLEKFYSRLNKKSGTKYYQSKCIKCFNVYDYNNDKNFKLKKAYGISLQDYNELLTKQNGKCSICGVDNNGYYRKKPRAFAVDHCHTTSKIRGLLCSDCNTGIGLLKDNIDLLNNAIKYLNNSRN